MLVTVKSLHEDAFTVETERCQIVSIFKEEIERLKGPSYAAKDIKLLYAGKFLRDNNRLCDYCIDERNFVILVLKKPKHEPDEEDIEIPDTPRSPSPIRTTSSDRLYAVDNVALHTYIQYQILVRRITELGFTRDQAEAALNIGDNDPDVTVEYLVRECIPGSSTSYRDPLASEPQSGPSSGRYSSPEISANRLLNIFAETVRECQDRSRLQDYAVQQQSALITETYEQMEAAHREALRNRPQAARLPNNALDGGLVFNSAQYWSPSIGFAGALRECDHEAIERLSRLGFSNQKVVEAYFICNRNEKAAAMYLINHHYGY